MPFEAMMMPALPFGVSPFMPPFMPPYVAPMYHGGPMPGGFSGGGGPGFTASTEVRANQGKCGPDKKGKPTILMSESSSRHYPFYC
jgi:hypothetical protein